MPSSSSGLPKNGILGISFDVENTLLTTKNIEAAEHYELAFHNFNNTKQESSSSILPQPKWMLEKDKIARDTLFDQAWTRATTERNLVRKLQHHFDDSDDDKSKSKTNLNLFCEAYAGTPFPEVVDEFYFLVVKYFFFPAATDEDEDTKNNNNNIIDEKLIRQFTHYLVHEYWVSTEAYCLPPRNAEALLEIVEKYPKLSFFVVSNTDDRCIDAVWLFPMYRQIFSSRKEQFVTATNVEWIHHDHDDEIVPALKPHPHGVRQCMMKTLMKMKMEKQQTDNEIKNNKPRNSFFIHVGDDVAADGGAAKNAECWYMKCENWKTGVDFKRLLEVLDSDEIVAKNNNKDDAGFWV